MTHHIASRDGTAIAFDRMGAGPTVVLVGGAMQHRAIDERTARLAALLAPGHTVLHYDRRGRGESGDTLPWAIEREVEDIAALIDAGGGSAALFGMSSGAVLALEAAASGLAVTRLALYEPPFIVDRSRPLPSEAFVARLAELIAAGRRGDAVAYFMTEGIGLPANAVAPMRESPAWPALEGVAPTLVYDAAIMRDTLVGVPLPVDRWDGVAVPVLVMDGGDSPEYQRTSVQALVDVLSNAERRTLQGQTHDADPTVLAPVLSRFFA